MGNRNFVSLYLGDNDFCSEMHFAMKSMIVEYPDVLKENSAEVIRDMMISFMLGSHLARHFWRGEKFHAGDGSIKAGFDFYYNYFKDAKVTFDEESTKKDWDHGGISIELHRNYIWSH